MSLDPELELCPARRALGDVDVPAVRLRDLSDDGERLGTVTSGTMSPTLNEPIALTYLPTEYADPGTEVAVVVRGTEKRARVTALPFIDR